MAVKKTDLLKRIEEKNTEKWMKVEVLIDKELEEQFVRWMGKKAVTFTEPELENQVIFDDADDLVHIKSMYIDWDIEVRTLDNGDLVLAFS